MSLSTNITRLKLVSLGAVSPGHFSPVGMVRDGAVYGNFVSATSGESRATRLGTDGEFHRLTEGLSLIESVSDDGAVVGCLGFGESSFVIVPGEGVIHVHSSDPIRLSCLASGGLFGGSQGGVGVVGDGRTWRVVHEMAVSVDVISADGRMSGTTCNGKVYLTCEGGKDFRETICDSNGAWPVGFIDSGLVMNRLVNGGLVAHVCRGSELEMICGVGGSGSRALAVGDRGEVLVVGRGEYGGLRYGIWRNGETDKVPESVESWQVLSVSGFAPDGGLFGLATRDGATHVVTLNWVEPSLGAVVELG